MDYTYERTEKYLRDKYGVELGELKPDYRLSYSNSKLAQSGIASFNLMAKYHCPMAGVCPKFCYALQGFQAFKGAVLKRARAYVATLQSDFVPRMIAEIRKAQKKGTRAIRIHDSGDFYSLRYMLNWIEIANSVPEMQFYAYTKSVSMALALLKQNRVPANLRLIQSVGGLEDRKIDSAYPHARIFETHDELVAAGYSDASDTDDVAAFTSDKNVGLVIHGSRKNNFNKQEAV